MQPNLRCLLGIYLTAIALCPLPSLGAQEPRPKLETILSNDLSGAADHPIVGRYEGSVLLAQSSKAFDEIVLPTGPAQGKLNKHEEQKYLSAITVQGRVTRSIYLAPSGRSSLEVTQNFTDALTKRGFKQVFSCAGSACGESFQVLKYHRSRPQTQVRGENYEHLRMLLLNHVLGASGGPILTDLRYSLLKKAGAAGDSYVSIYGARHTATGNVYANALTDRIGILTDVVEPREMESRMVIVKAADIANQIASEGRALFYGILFDFDKADIQPESKPQLAEMANFLRSNSSVRAFVIGHTDNKGALEYNLGLSDRRAAAVVKALTSEHGIAADRVIARGLGPLAPVASNRTEEGRARNRRVELVEQ